MLTSPNRPAATAIAVAVALVGSAFVAAPCFADGIKVGSSSPSTNGTKGIESSGGTNGGIKSAPFDPVTVTFPKTSQAVRQPAGHAGLSMRGARRR